MFAAIDQEILSAVRLSLYCATIAATVSTPLAVAIGYVLARRRTKLALLIQIVSYLPLVMPPVVSGYLLLVLFVPQGPLGAVLGKVGISVPFSRTAVVLAMAVVSLPLMVQAARIAFEQVDPALEQTARSLGAGFWRTFFSVSLPLAAHGVLTGWLLGFARSVGEFGATAMIAGNIPGRTQTIPLAIYSFASRPGGLMRCVPLVVLSILIATVAIVAGEALTRVANNGKGH